MKARRGREASPSLVTILRLAVNTDNDFEFSHSTQENCDAQARKCEECQFMVAKEDRQFKETCRHSAHSILVCETNGVQSNPFTINIR